MMMIHDSVLLRYYYVSIGDPTVHFTCYYYRYSALGPVWTETRAQSDDWYGFGTLHPGQVLRVSLPLLVKIGSVVFEGLKLTR